MSKFFIGRHQDAVAGRDDKGIILSSDGGLYRDGEILKTSGNPSDQPSNYHFLAYDTGQVFKVVDGRILAIYPDYHVMGRHVWHFNRTSSRWTRYDFGGSSKRLIEADSNGCDLTDLIGERQLLHIAHKNNVEFDQLTNQSANQSYHCKIIDKKLPASIHLLLSDGKSASLLKLEIVYQANLKPVEFGGERGVFFSSADRKTADSQPAWTVAERIQGLMDSTNSVLFAADPEAKFILSAMPNTGPGSMGVFTSEIRTPDVVTDDTTRINIQASTKTNEIYGQYTLESDAATNSTQLRFAVPDPALDFQRAWSWRFASVNPSLSSAVTTVGDSGQPTSRLVKWGGGFIVTPKLASNDKLTLATVSTSAFAKRQRDQQQQQQSTLMAAETFEVAVVNFGTMNPIGTIHLNDSVAEFVSVPHSGIDEPVGFITTEAFKLYILFNLNEPTDSQSRFATLTADDGSTSTVMLVYERDISPGVDGSYISISTVVGLTPNFQPPPLGSLPPRIPYTEIYAIIVSMSYP